MKDIFLKTLKELKDLKKENGKIEVEKLNFFFRKINTEYKKVENFYQKENELTLEVTLNDREKISLIFEEDDCENFELIDIKYFKETSLKELLEKDKREKAVFVVTDGWYENDYEWVETDLYKGDLLGLAEFIEERIDYDSLEDYEDEENFDKIMDILENKELTEWTKEDCFLILDEVLNFSYHWFFLEKDLDEE